MATKNFAINTEPHRANLSQDRFLLFEPEVDGAVFFQQFARFRETQARASAAGEDASGEEIVAVPIAMRAFLVRFMLPESRDAATRIDVTKDGKALESVHDWDAARTCEKKHPGSEAQYHLPISVPTLTKLVEWLAVEYGGGSGNAPGGASSGS